MMITTTLAKIRKHHPCEDGWKKLYKSLGGIKKHGEHTPIKFSQIVESNGPNDALWCLRTICPEHEKEVRLFAADCAERVLPLFEEKLPKDKRPREAIQAARDFAEGKITEEQMDVAWDAAWAAARDAAWDAAWAAARAAAMAATVGNNDYWLDAWAAVSFARDATEDATEDAVMAAWNAEKKIQTEMLIERFS